MKVALLHPTALGFTHRSSTSISSSSHRLERKLESTEARMFPTINFDGVDPAFAGFVRQYGAIFEAIKLGLLQGFLVPLDRFLHWLPPWAFLIAVGALAFGATRRWLPSIVYVGFIYFIGAMGLWDKLMSSMAIVTVSTVLCIVIGIPLGILVSRSRSEERRVGKEC